MNKLKKVTVVYIGFLLLILSVYAVSIGQIEIPWTIVQNSVVMSPNIINLVGHTWIWGETYTEPIADTGADLIVYIPTSITVTVSGASGFSSFSVTLTLYDTGVPTSFTITTSTSGVITNVAVNTYDIWLSYTGTALSVNGAGTVIVALTY